MAYMCRSCRNLGKQVSVDNKGRWIDVCLRCGSEQRRDKRHKQPITAGIFIASLEARTKWRASTTAKKRTKE